MRGWIGRALALAAMGVLVGSTIAAASPISPATTAVRWLHVYPGIGSSVAVAPAPDKGVYALATIAGKAVVRHISANGSVLAKVTAGSGHGEALASDATGYYVAWWDGSHEHTDGFALTLRKYGTSNNVVWTKRWGTADEVGEFHGVAALDGKVYVQYSHEGAFGPRVRVMDGGDGSLRNDWPIDDANAGAIAVNGSAVYTATIVASPTATGTSVNVERWSLTGAHIWGHLITVGTNALTITSMAVDASGVSTAFWYVKDGYQHMVVERDTFAGNKDWSRSFASGIASQVAADATGIYVSWSSYAGTTHYFDVYVRKLSLAGAKLWTQRLGVDHAHDYAYSLTAGPKAVFVGAASGGFDKSPMVASLKKTGP